MDKKYIFLGESTAPMVGLNFRIDVGYTVSNMFCSKDCCIWYFLRVYSKQLFTFVLWNGHQWKSTENLNQWAMNYDAPAQLTLNIQCKLFCYFTFRVNNIDAISSRKILFSLSWQFFSVIPDLNCLTSRNSLNCWLKAIPNSILPKSFSQLVFLRHPKVYHIYYMLQYYAIAQLTFTCSKSTTETLRKGAKYVQS